MSTTIAVPRAFDHVLPRHLEPRGLLASHVADPSRFGSPTHILVATDASASVEAAIGAARVLAGRGGAVVEMIAVYAPRIPLPASRGDGILRAAPSDRRAIADLLRHVRRQRVRALPDVAERRGWRIRLGIGDPGSTIAYVADEVKADLIVMGVTVREPSFRRQAIHTAVAVARYATTPLYVAASGCEVPQRCVVALPAGRLHAATLRAAVGSLPPGAHVWVAIPDSASRPEALSAESARAIVARTCGEEWSTRVANLHVDFVSMSGDMLAAVLRLADDVDAQLIAVPNHGEPGPVRAFLPNLSDPILLGARCSVLVVPDAAR